MAVFGKKWTSAEIALLDKYDDIEELKLRLPDRTEGAIKSKISQLKRAPEYKEPRVPWTRFEIDQFPTEKAVNKDILQELAVKLSRDKNHLWSKMKSLGYTWVKIDHVLEATEDNPYPMHGQKWTQQELAHFPENKEVTKEILDEVISKIPLRKPTSIWPKMRSLGYIWVPDEVDAQEVKGLSKDELYVLSLAHELGFRKTASPALEPYLSNVEDHRSKIASKYDLPEDFTQGELYYAIGTRITPFPWDMDMLPEVRAAYRNEGTILDAAKALHSKLERFING